MSKRERERENKKETGRWTEKKLDSELSVHMILATVILITLPINADHLTESAEIIVLIDDTLYTGYCILILQYYIYSIHCILYYFINYLQL